MRAKGFSVVASHCPLSSLANDVDAVRRTIKMQDGPVLLVGHSWGGAVITEAGNESQVRGLVYIAAAAPDSGQTFNAWWKEYPVAPGAPEIKPYDVRGGNDAARIEAYCNPGRIAGTFPHKNIYLRKKHE
jgi:pimeloyl-ACP methyl ester carboxylesterase